MDLGNRGFTLVEVLAVLIILAAIMGLAIPSFSSSLEVSEEKQEKNRISRIESASEIYITNNKKDVYNNLGTNDSCYISVNTLAAEGYISIDDESNVPEFVIFTKPNTLKLKTNASELIACK